MSDYKRNPRGARRARKSMGRKALVVLSLMLVLVLAAVGGTVAWLTDSTDAVTNTFTVGDINITLTETWNTASVEDGEKDSWTAKMIPGNQYLKDPKVTVQAGSEACYLFVKFTESDKADTYLNYSFRAEGWTQGDGDTIPANVWYREIDATTAQAGTSFYLLTGNTTYPNGYVEIDADAVTKNTMTEAAAVTLTFQAYAVQKDNVSTAAEAWAKLPTP